MLPSESSQASPRRTGGGQICDKEMEIKVLQLTVKKHSCNVFNGRKTQASPPRTEGDPRTERSVYGNKSSAEKTFTVENIHVQRLRFVGFVMIVSNTRLSSAYGGRSAYRSETLTGSNIHVQQILFFVFVIIVSLRITQSSSSSNFKSDVNLKSQSS